MPSAEMARPHQCGGYPHDQSGSAIEYRFAEHTPHDARALGAESDHDAELAPALRHRVRHNSIDTHQRQQRSQHRERAEQCQEQTRATQGLSDLRVHRLDARERHIAVDRPERLADGCDQ